MVQRAANEFQVSKYTVNKALILKNKPGILAEPAENWGKKHFLKKLYRR
jgi:hypothetical protein